jgi:hypothetical protein
MPAQLAHHGLKEKRAISPDWNPAFPGTPDEPRLPTLIINYLKTANKRRLLADIRKQPLRNIPGVFAIILHCR